LPAVFELREVGRVEHTVQLPLSGRRGVFSAEALNQDARECTAECPGEPSQAVGGVTDLEFDLFGSGFVEVGQGDNESPSTFGVVAGRPVKVTAEACSAANVVHKLIFTPSGLAGKG